MVSGSEWEEQQRIKLTQSAVHLASVSSPFYSGAAERRVRAKEETAGGAAAAAAAAAGGRTDSLTCAELSPGYAPHPAATSAARRTKARRKGQAEAGWPSGAGWPYGGGATTDCGLLAKNGNSTACGFWKFGSWSWKRAHKEDFFKRIFLRGFF